MRKLARIALNLLTVLSLLLLTVTIALWVRSYFVNDQLRWWSERNEPALNEWRDIGVDWGRGFLNVDYRWRQDSGRFASPTRMTSGFTYERLGPEYGVRFHIDGPGPQFERFGIVLSFKTDDEPRHKYFGFNFTLCFWQLAVVSSVLPVVRLVRCVITRNAASIGHCTTCGYDLRATPERCPECGTAVAPGVLLARNAPN